MRFLCLFGHIWSAPYTGYSNKGGVETFRVWQRDCEHCNATETRRVYGAERGHGKPPEDWT